MKLSRCLTLFACVVVSAASFSAARADENPNPRVAPIGSTPYGMTYDEWAAIYRIWQTGIPAERNPVRDPTGEFCGEEQSGPVWFLASLLGPGSTDRECSVPAGKAVYVPLVGILSWAPDDIEELSFLLELFLGIDTSQLTDEEILRDFSNWVLDGVGYLSLTVDGVPYEDLFSYRAESPAFDMEDSDLYDSVGVPYSHPNLSVTVGYALILLPLPAGEHTIEVFAQFDDSPLLGNAALAVTYHLTVGE